MNNTFFCFKFKLVLFLVFLFLNNSIVYSQSKKKQIELLNRMVDSLNQRAIDFENQFLKIKSDLTNTKSLFENLKENNQLLIDENKKLETEFFIKSNLLNILQDSINILRNNSSKKLLYDTIHSRIIHKCYYYDGDFPYIVSSPQNDSVRKEINKLIQETCFKIPSVMSNRNYKDYRNCSSGDYDHKNDPCGWCTNDFQAFLSRIENDKYFSILFQVSFSAGGNWGHTGYNSLNLKDGKIITIPNDLNVKKKFMEEISEYFKFNPLVDIEGRQYPIIDEIKNWMMTDLTFYFKENKLRLIFVNGAHGLWNQTIDIELPRLQDYLNL
jgi:hypothetical protein